MREDGMRVGDGLMRLLVLLRVLWMLMMRWMRYLKCLRMWRGRIRLEGEARRSCEGQKVSVEARLDDETHEYERRTKREAKDPSCQL